MQIRACAASSSPYDAAVSAASSPAPPRHPALFAAHPALTQRIPHLALGHFPTRVEALDGIPGVSERASLWIKRDDQSGAIYGGNKVRKLEFLLAEARARGATRVLTVGAWGSHHVVATGVYGREVGLPVDAVVVPQPSSPHMLDNLRAGAACGVAYFPVGSYPAAAARIVALRARRHTAWIPAGGSSPTGTLGYLSAAFELAAQIRAGECPDFDDIYVAFGSSGTAAGLWAGLRLAGLRARLVAVRVVERAFCNRGTLLRLARRTAHRIDRRADLPRRPADDDLHVEHGQFGAAYAVATDAGRDAIVRAQAAGLHLETTYTAKAFAALLADAASGRLDGRRVLFWNTYNSVDLAPLLARAPSPATLPPELARLLGAASIT